MWPMNVLRQLSGRPSRVWLAASALLCIVAVLAILGATSRTPDGGLRQVSAPKSAPTTTPVATPTITTPPTVPPGSAVVVGIGDSVTSATVCGCTGFVEAYAAHLPSTDGGPAQAVNLGSNGLTAGGLRTLMTSPGPTATGVARGAVSYTHLRAHETRHD